MNPLVTVVIVAQASFVYMKKAIDSVLKSEEKNLEILISPADSFEYDSIKAIFNDNRITVLKPDISVRGRGAAKNRALWMAKGEFICVLDADDYWKEGWLDKMLPLAKENGVVYSSTEHIKAPENKLISISNNDNNLNINLRNYTTSHTTLYSLIRVDKSMPWPNCFGSDAMREMLVLAKNNGKAVFCPEAVYCVRVHDKAETLTSKAVDKAYSDMLLKLIQDPKGLGIEKELEPHLEELKYYFTYRRAVNRLYEIQRKPNYTYYEFVRDHKISPDKLKLK